GAEYQQEEQPDGERRLNHHEGGFGECNDLRPDSNETQDQSEDPPRSSQQARKQSQAETQAPRRCAGLQALKRDPDVEQRRCKECRTEAESEHLLLRWLELGLAGENPAVGTASRA